MPLKLGLSSLQSVRLGENRLRAVMVGKDEVWRSWDPYYDFYSVPQQQPPLREWSVHDTVTIPHDMVARVRFSLTWRGGYVSQAQVIRVGNQWVSHVSTGQKSMATERTIFLAAGTQVSFLSYNNTSSTTRWIDSGYTEIQAVNSAPQYSGGVFLLGLDRYTNTVIGTFVPHRPMKVNLSITNFSWRQSSSNFPRALGIRVNSTLVGTSANQATSLFVSNLSLNKGDVVSFVAWSDSDSASYREISGGSWNVNVL